MTTKRIKEIQSKTPYPESVSVQQALLQVWNECEQEQLQLHNVVGQSGQLPCGDCENYAEWDNGIRWCSVCGTKLS